MSLADLNFDNSCRHRPNAFGLHIATANRNPGMAEFLNGSEGGCMGDEFGVRPVLDLS